MYIVVDVLRNSEPFFVETDKKTTRCYFLGLIFAYVTLDEVPQFKVWCRHLSPTHVFDVHTK